MSAISNPRICRSSILSFDQPMNGCHARQSQPRGQRLGGKLKFRSLTTAPTRIAAVSRLRLRGTPQSHDCAYETKRNETLRNVGPFVRTGWGRTPHGRSPFGPCLADSRCAFLKNLCANSHSNCKQGFDKVRAELVDCLCRAVWWMENASSSFRKCQQNAKVVMGTGPG